MQPAQPRKKNLARNRQLTWFQSLQFKLGMVFFVLIVLLGAGALAASKFLVGDKLVAETFRYETESGKRLVSEFSDLAERVEALADTLAKLAANTPGGPYGLKPPIPKLVDRKGGSNTITAVGIWPLPKTLDPLRERASLFWVRDSAGILQVREDYNNPATVPYFREKWFTPSRYGQEDRCWWTPIYREPLSKRDVTTCVMPMRQAGVYIGAVTVSLSLESLAAEFSAATKDDLGYSLLVDDDNRILSSSARAKDVIGDSNSEGGILNLAGLAQQHDSYKPIALALYKQDEERISTVARSPLYNAADISALKEASRDMSRAEAESALSAIWSSLGNLHGNEGTQKLQIAQDAVIGDEAFAAVFPMAETHWQLIRFTPAKEGFTGAQYVFRQSLLVTGGGVVLLLVLVFSGLRYLVVNPLRHMTHQLAEAGAADDALHLAVDESATNEIGILGYWLNERTRELRELMERTIATNSQLVMESEERRSAQEQLARIQERATLALQSVADGVITADDKGHIEDMNPVAETLTGVSLRTARGKDLADVFIARMGGDNGAPLPNLAMIAMQRGTRLEYADGVRLASFGGTQRDIALFVTPIRARHNKVIGSVLVFRETQSAAQAAPANGAADHRQTDAITGLMNRSACDRQIKNLIEAARVNPRHHSLLALDLDHLKRVNETGGQAAGDEVLSKIGETLLAKTGSAGQVFRLAADQFAVLLQNFDAQRARTFAEALREAIGNTRFYWESRYFGITASFGITDFDGSEDSPVDVVRRADDACAAAKRAGRNTVRVYEAAMNRSSREVDDSTWIRRIRAGLDQNMFHLTTQFIQPSQQLHDEGPAFEILLALEDEEGFWAAPGAFLPAAERHHLSAEMDRWVISRTLAQLSRHPELLEKASMVSINLSGGSLLNGDLLAHVVSELETHAAVHPRKLCFELNERDIAEYPQQAQALCDALRSAGCRITVDHFLGRDTSHLTHVRRLPVDFLKVDGMLFKGLANDPVEQIMAESIVKLARGMRRRVMVANIDDSAQMDAWRRLGVDYFQGFIVAKPTPVVFQLPH